MLDAELSAKAIPHAEDEDEECHRRASVASWASSDEICSVGRISLKQQLVVVKAIIHTIERTSLAV